MNVDRVMRALRWLPCIIFLWSEAALSVTMTSPPQFLLPNAATNSPVTFASERPVVNGYSLSAMYYDADGNPVWQRSGAVYNNAPGEISWAKDASNGSSVYADPTSFEAKTSHWASTNGSVNNYTYGSSQTWNWYVLSGDPGASVALSVDILIQGQSFANFDTGGNAGTIFGVSLGFLASPSDLEQDYVIVLNGAVNWDAGFSTNNTVNGDFVWDEGAGTQDINVIVRSQPFTVTVGVPFRLSLLTSTQGFAGPGGSGAAWSDFFDPRLVTSADFSGISQLTANGFSVLQDDEYLPLSEAGYAISGIPEPGSLGLLGLGLAGMLAAWRRHAKAG